VKAAAHRRLALGEAMADLERLGVPVEVDPAEAMLQMVYEAAGNVAVLRGWVQQLRGAESLIEGADADDVLEAMAQLGSGKTTVAKSRKGVVAGRVDPTNWKAAPHVLVTMYNDERGRLVKWAKDCRDAGVEDRRIQLAERQGELLAGVLRSLLAGLLGALTAAGRGAGTGESGPGSRREPLFRQPRRAGAHELATPARSHNTRSPGLTS
jgi:hypothetical protein